MKPLHLSEEDKALLCDPKKRAAWIKFQLAKRDIVLAELAQQDGVTPGNIYQVWRKAFPRVEKLLADQLGLAPQDLFPERYDAEGNTLPRGTRRHMRKEKRPAPPVGGENRAAA